MRDKSPHWTKRVFAAVLVLLFVAIGARVAWELLAPLLPTLVVLAALVIIYAVIFGRQPK